MTALGRRVARRLGYELRRGAALPRRTSLMARGRLIGFLRPEWGAEELRAAESPHTPDDLERRLLDTLAVGGLAVPTSSGRTALLVALRALRREHPDRTEVVLPSFSCWGLAAPVLDAGLVPVLVDVGPDLNVRASDVGAALTPRTLAAVIVHLGGKQASETPAIERAVAANGAVAIADLCQAFGGRTGNDEWGATAPMAIYSFGLGKNLMATAGGLLIARTALGAVADEARRLGDEPAGAAPTRFAYMLRAFHRRGLRQLGARPAPPREALTAAYGYHRMSPLDRRLVAQQLRRLDEILTHRARNAAILIERLAGLPGVAIPGREGRNVWTKFVVTATATAAETNDIRSGLATAGVETEDLYVPLHLRGVTNAVVRAPLPITEAVHGRAFSLPIRPSLTAADTEYVAMAMRAAAGAGRTSAP